MRTVSIFALLAALAFLTAALPAADPILIPKIDGGWWNIAGNPDLGKCSTPKQEPVDFGVWQAADGTWQLWSCVRQTSCGKRTRLFHRWQGAKITDPDWQPMGIAMQADASFGETDGGLQAPFVLKTGKDFRLFYGSWEDICQGKGMDGKTFARQLLPNGKSSMFSEGPGTNTRDVMVLPIGKLYYAYYTAVIEKKGSVYARTTKDFLTWSPSKIVAFGGSAGEGPGSAECPFVYYHKESKSYYLFRTQKYGRPGVAPQTSVYRSKDPMSFGVKDDRYLVGTLPIAAPEFVEHEGQLYVVALLESLKGMRAAKVSWVAKP